MDYAHPTYLLIRFVCGLEPGWVKLELALVLNIVVTTRLQCHILQLSLKNCSIYVIYSFVFVIIAFVWRLLESTERLLSDTRCKLAAILSVPSAKWGIFKARINASFSSSLLLGTQSPRPRFSSYRLWQAGCNMMSGILKPTGLCSSVANLIAFCWRFLFQHAPYIQQNEAVCISSSLESRWSQT